MLLGVAGDFSIELEFFQTRRDNLFGYNSTNDSQNKNRGAHQIIVDQNVNRRVGGLRNGFYCGLCDSCNQRIGASGDYVGAEAGSCRCIGDRHAQNRVSPHSGINRCCSSRNEHHRCIGGKIAVDADKEDRGGYGPRRNAQQGFAHDRTDKTGGFSQPHGNHHYND